MVFNFLRKTSRKYETKSDWYKVREMNCLKPVVVVQIREVSTKTLCSCKDTTQRHDRFEHSET